jgi:hypothetical protein
MGAPHGIVRCTPAARGGEIGQNQSRLAFNGHAGWAGLGWLAGWL